MTKPPFVSSLSTPKSNIPVATVSMGAMLQGISYYANWDTSILACHLLTWLVWSSESCGVALFLVCWLAKQLLFALWFTLNINTCLCISWINIRRSHIVVRSFSVWRSVVTLLWSFPDRCLRYLLQWLWSLHCYLVCRYTDCGFLSAILALSWQSWEDSPHLFGFHPSFYRWKIKPILIITLRMIIFVYWTASCINKI